MPTPRHAYGPPLALGLCCLLWLLAAPRGVSASVAYALGARPSGLPALWLLKAGPSSPPGDHSTVLVLGKAPAGSFGLFRPGESAAGGSGSLPASFGGAGWRSERPWGGEFAPGHWRVSVQLWATWACAADGWLWARLMKGRAADGSDAVPILAWTRSEAHVDVHHGETVGVDVELPSLTPFHEEHLFVELAFELRRRSYKDCSAITLDTSLRRGSNLSLPAWTAYTPTPTATPAPSATVTPSPSPSPPPAVQDLPARLSRNLFKPAEGPLAISLSLGAAGDVDVDIYDSRGRLVRRLRRGPCPAGWSSFDWDGSGEAGPLPSDLYFVRVSAPGRSRNLKVYLAR